MSTPNSAAADPLADRNGQCGVMGCRHQSILLASVCGPCSIRGRRSVQVLSGRWLELRERLVPGAVGLSQRLARATPAARAPVSASMFDAMESVEAVYKTADYAMREALVLPMRSYVNMRAGLAIGQCQKGLLAQWDRMMVTEIAGPVIRHLLVVRLRVEHMLGHTPLIHKLPAPCPTCDNLTLCRYSGDELVRCLTCGSSWPEDSYRHLVKVLVDSAGTTAGTSVGRPERDLRNGRN